MEITVPRPGAFSKKSKTAIGIEFASEEGLDEWSVLRMRILQQAIADYAAAYKHLSLLKKLPTDFSLWDKRMYRYAYDHIRREQKMMKDVINFLHSDWYKTLYADLNPDIVERQLIAKCKATYGAMIGEVRIKQIRKEVRKWSHENYMKANKENGKKKKGRRKKETDNENYIIPSRKRKTGKSRNV